MKRARLWLSAALCAAGLATSAAAQDYRARLPEDEVIYFVLPDRFENGDRSNDRGGLKGGRLQTGFDPTHKGFYHGGDLKGMIARLDYVAALGATAIWLGPVFRNKPVQGAPGQESAGYHGYWVTDFTSVDPHFGSNADFAALVEAAHARGMKVYMDIIANHTADVISYRECPHSSCVYRSRADYPYSRRARDGAAINPGFLGDRIGTSENFAKLTDFDFAYTPFVAAHEALVKKPDWLNDIANYHNRGNTTYEHETATMGDFVGLDDLMTEKPAVVQGMIDIYADWIDRFKVDGFRIDTARHVNPEFWQKFVPAMRARAAANGIPNFHIFGEIGGVGLEPGKLAVHTRVDGFPAVLDFAFRAALIDALAAGRGTDRIELLFDGDPLYEGGVDAARQQPTFISSHDDGRFATFVRRALPNASNDEVLKRVSLGYAMLMTLRGVPIIYAGDEQGFASDGGDQDAREDQFGSLVASYNDNQLLGTSATTAQPRFDQSHPLFSKIAKLAALRRDHAALRRGQQIVRNYGDMPGLFAVSRVDPQTKSETLLIFNTAATPLSTRVEVDPASTRFTSLYGACPQVPVAPGSLAVELAPLDFIICAAAPNE